MGLFKEPYLLYATNGSPSPTIQVGEYGWLHFFLLLLFSPSREQRLRPTHSRVNAMNVVNDERMIAECDYVKAQLLQDALEEKNISCRLVDQNGVMSVMTTGGNVPMVRLYVPCSEYGKAVEAVKPLLEDKASPLSWCPKCGSEDVSREATNKRRGSIWLLVGGVMIIIVGIIMALGVQVILGAIFWVACIFLFYGYYHPDKEVYVCNKCGQV